MEDIRGGFLGKADRVIRRMVSYGYKVGEVDLPLPTEIKDMTFQADLCRPKRNVTGVSLGPIWLGVARPKVDLNDPVTKLAGAMKRVGRKPPQFDRQLRKEFHTFVQQWLEENLSPLSPDTDVSFGTWLANTNYPSWRRLELQREYEECTLHFSDKAVKAVKGFIKDETYGEYKHARWIMSRTDSFKNLYGPWIKVIEREVYKHPSFIKHIPVLDRGTYISELLGTQGPFYETDYTAYESHFTGKVMRDLEFQLYKHMTKLIPGAGEFMRMNFSVVGSCNSISSKNVSFEVEARMSGEMSTSLGNGFSNLMTMLFVAEKHQCKNVRGVVEGDDGLFSFEGRAPTTEDFAKLGFTIKLDRHSFIGDCSFCGLIFDEIEQAVVTDPIKVLANFGWTTRQYLHASDRTLNALLRCKAMSLLAQYPGAPIIQEVAVYALRQTSHVKDIEVKRVVNRMKMSTYERDKFKLCTTAKPVGPLTRELVGRRFGITPKLQLKVEDYFKSKNDLLPFDLKEMKLLAHPHTTDYFDDYVVCFPHIEGTPFPDFGNDEVVADVLGNAGVQQ